MVLVNHLNSRIALGVPEGTPTYLGYAGMTRSTGLRARAAKHLEGTSGSKLVVATQGACARFFDILIIQVGEFASVRRAEWAARRRRPSNRRARPRESPAPRRRSWFSRKRGS